MKVLVAGASGFIGSLLTKKLVKSGFNVCVLTRSLNKTFPNGVKVVIGDLCSSNLNLSGVIDDCDVIFNCAGEINDTKKMYALHVQGTQKLLNEVNSSGRTQKSVHWVQLSSVGAYGPPSIAGTPRVVIESTPCNPKGEYGITKTLADELLIGTARNENITFTILRPSNVVGMSMANQSFFNFLNRIRKGMFFYIGSRDSIVTYVHVDDVVNAMLLCATHENARNQVFNLSNDCNLSDIVTKIKKSKKKCMRVPEKLLRIVVKLCLSVHPLPITNKMIDALVAKTTYPTSKITHELGFHMHYAIPDFALLCVDKNTKNKYE